MKEVHRGRSQGTKLEGCTGDPRRSGSGPPRGVAGKVIDLEVTEAPPDGGPEGERTETRDWLAALDNLIRRAGPTRGRRLLAQLGRRAAVHGVAEPPPEIGRAHV